MNGCYEYSPIQNWVCAKHGIQMVISFYDRPGGPPGNNWVCPKCVKERAEREANIGAFYPNTRFPEGSEL